MYLSFPDYVSAGFASLFSPDDTYPDNRISDRIQYWLAYAHFGRFGGRIPGCARVGICDQMGKATWALFGLAPPVMFVTGAVMWWNRVLTPLRRTQRTESALPSAV